ncbi:hypothetical protein AVEN_102743-1 [Araneus ventricosus]|uniref:DUF5641 domain-containing protein n=1 Tax=Araneus ventricosus TaxID=182803 RepID=A0A4Y2HRH4_ARAVE|nr:hypothetical protein AVEN_102743-1 [Araneus ventricosus]
MVLEYGTTRTTCNHPSGDDEIAHDPSMFGATISVLETRHGGRFGKIEEETCWRRGRVIKLLNIFEKLFSHEQGEEHLENLSSSCEFLIEYQEKLKTLDSAIDALIIDEKECDRELLVCEVYGEKIMTFEAKIVSKTKKINSNKVVKGRDASVTGSGANSMQNGNSGASIRLPKLSLEKFAGDPRLNWDADQDSLGLDVSQFRESLNEHKITKRLILQTVAKIYDPIGFVSAYVVRAKFMIRELWESGCDWNFGVSDELRNKFLIWYSEIEELVSINIPRTYSVCGSVIDTEDMILIAFADASIKGCGSVAYFQNPTTLETSFAISKSRVAPLKKLTLPRLEFTTMR